MSAFGDTARIPFGVGTYASRNAVMAGSAALGAAQRVRDKAIQVAAHLFEASLGDVEWKDGVARIVGVPGKSYTLAELAEAARRAEIGRLAWSPASRLAITSRRSSRPSHMECT